ncbi:MAG: MerR family DNA-binding protein [Gammaproteobacteria bacterium]|nr:MerR family DNA-binding protein [Gammaproteobacteria bacterium]MDH5620539.1 MerR family DNA-binding protein [Gammaproteobacteria bacterium]
MYESSTRFEGSLHVADLARRAAVTPATVRYYARIGLINSRKDPNNGYRCFSGTDIRRIAFIRRAQAFGLTIGDIKRILDSADNDRDPCEMVKSMVADRLARVRARIAELAATEERIGQAILAWRAMGDPSPVDGELCPLVERLAMTNDGLQIQGKYQNVGSMGRLGQSATKSRGMSATA